MCKVPLRLIFPALILAALLMMVLAGCGGGSSSGSSELVAPDLGNSGVEGSVRTIPPTPTSTQTSPVSGATISVQPQGGGPEITHVVTDGSGNYQVTLSPGTYTLVPEPVSSTLVPVAGAQNVIVRLKQYTEQDFSYYNPANASIPAPP